MIDVRRLQGDELSQSINALAELRMTVFRDFPYLYEGSAEYEKVYLQTYLRSPRSVMIAAYDRGKIIGASSAIPLVDENDYIKKPFIDAGMNLDEIFYFGESVLLKQYRGFGLGNQFFDGREQAAMSYGDYNKTSFCAVQRPPDHPMRPQDFRPLDGFWEKRGYHKRPDLKAEFSWTEVGDTKETPKTMMYWMKEW